MLLSKISIAKNYIQKNIDNKIIINKSLNIFFILKEKKYNINYQLVGLLSGILEYSDISLKQLKKDLPFLTNEIIDGIISVTKFDNMTTLESLQNAFENQYGKIVKTLIILQDLMFISPRRNNQEEVFKIIIKFIKEDTLYINENNIFFNDIVLNIQRLYNNFFNNEYKEKIKKELNNYTNLLSIQIPIYERQLKKDYIKYSLRHKKAFLDIEKRILGKNTLRGYFHDLDKVILYCIFDPKKVSNWHKNHAKHHIAKAKKEKDYLEMMIDWQCANLTKLDKPLDAYDTLYLYYPSLEEKMLPLLEKYNLV